jgi:hypothetical protein
MHVASGRIVRASSHAPWSTLGCPTPLKGTTVGAVLLPLFQMARAVTQFGVLGEAGAFLACHRHPPAIVRLPSEQF